MRYNRGIYSWLRGFPRMKEDPSQHSWSPWTPQKEHLVPRSKKKDPDSNEEAAKRGALCSECPGGFRCCQYPE